MKILMNNEIDYKLKKIKYGVKNNRINKIIIILIFKMANNKRNHSRI